MKNNIAAIRKEKNITKQKLADMVGVSSNWMHHIESGKRRPSIKVLEKVAEKLEVPIQDIFLD